MVNLGLLQKIQKIRFDTMGLGGSLSDLLTTDKSSILAGLNEVKTQANGNTTYITNHNTAAGGIYNTDGTFNPTNVENALVSVSSPTDLLNTLDQMDQYMADNRATLENLTLNDLTDVNIDRLTDPVVLVYNTTSQMWEERPIWGDIEFIDDASTGYWRIKDDAVTFDKLDNTMIDTDTVSNSVNHLATSAAIQTYVNQMAIQGGSAKEAILDEIQFSTDHPNTDGIRAATMISALATQFSNDGNTGNVIVDGDSITFIGKPFSATDSSASDVTVTFTFKDSPVNTTDVQIGANDAETISNLNDAINTYKATEETNGTNNWVVLSTTVDYPEFWFLSDRSIVVAGAAAFDGYRLYGSFTNANYVKMIDFRVATSHYDYTSDDKIDIPTSDPGTTNFGFFRTEADCDDGELHYVLISDTLWALDKGGTTDYQWNLLSGIGAIPDATSAPGGATKGKVTFDENYGLTVIAGTARAKVGNGLAFDANGNFTLADRSGNGIVVSGGLIDAKYDDVTIGVDASGNLYVKDVSITAAKLGSDVTGLVLPAGYTPTNYSPSEVSSEGTDKISAHLKGIDNALSGISSDTNYDIEILNGKANYYKENTIGVNGEVDKISVWVDSNKDKLRYVVDFNYDSDGKITSTVQKYYAEDGADEGTATLEKSMQTDFTYNSDNVVISENHYSI